MVVPFGDELVSTVNPVVGGWLPSQEIDLKTFPLPAFNTVLV